MRAIVIGLAVLLAGCAASGVIGDGKPTTIDCKGKGTGNVGPYSINMNCGDAKDFQLKINVQ
jgi:hypothetical protein